MSGEDKCFVCGWQVILATPSLMPSVMAVMNLATFPRTAPTTFLHQEYHTTMTDLIQGINTPTTGRTDHIPFMVPDIRDITADHSPSPIHTMTEAAALEGTPHTLFLATAAAHVGLQLMDVPVTSHIVVPTGKVALHPKLTISPTGTAPCTGAILTPATSTTPHKDLSQGMSRNAQDHQPP